MMSWLDLKIEKQFLLIHSVDHTHRTKREREAIHNNTNLQEPCLIDGKKNTKNILIHKQKIDYLLYIVYNYLSFIKGWGYWSGTQAQHKQLTVLTSVGAQIQVVPPH